RRARRVKPCFATGVSRILDVQPLPSDRLGILDCSAIAIAPTSLWSAVRTAGICRRAGFAGLIAEIATVTSASAAAYNVPLTTAVPARSAREAASSAWQIQADRSDVLGK